MQISYSKCVRMIGTLPPIFPHAHYSIFQWCIGNNDQRVSRNFTREGEVVTKQGQTGFFSHTGSPATLGSGIFSDETAATTGEKKKW